MIKNVKYERVNGDLDLVVLSYLYDGLTSIKISWERTLKLMLVIFAATSQ
jgi:hypothetical protein